AAAASSSHPRRCESTYISPQSRVTIYYPTCRPWALKVLYIDDHLGFPLGADFRDAQAVIGDRLDFVLHVVPRTIERLAPGTCSAATSTHWNLKCAEEEMLGVEVIEQFAQPIEEEIFDLVGLKPHVDFLERPHRGQILNDSAKESLRRLDK